jgi:hypothetical protein
MSRPQLPPKLAGVALTHAARSYADAPDADGIYISEEIVNDLGYNTLILRTMPEAEVGTATIDIKVQAYDELTAVWYDIAGASLAQISANRTTPIDLVVGVNLTAVANRVVSQPLPNRMRAHCTIATSGTDGFTFGIGYELHCT